MQAAHSELFGEKTVKLNSAERALMNNPVRALVQRHYEAPLLRRLGGGCEGAEAIEIGCGRGVGTEIVMEVLGAKSVLALDLDAEMVDLARSRLARFGDRVVVRVGDACEIPAGDNSADVVFDFGIVHHIPDWRRAVSEVARVLRPGGTFYFEEVTRHALERRSYRRFLVHPEYDRFDARQFVAAVEDAGIEVGGRWVTRIFGDFVIGAGKAN